MASFQSASEAEQFIVSRIMEEAELEGTPLSDVERKLLYFSSEADEDSEPEGDLDDSAQEEFERKIALLVNRANKRCRTESRPQYALWQEAIRLLRGSDRYLIVMIDRAGLRPPWDFAKLLGTAVAVVVALLAAIVLLDKFNIELPSGEAVGFYLWVVVLSFGLVYLIARLLVGPRVDDLTSKLIEKTFKPKRH